ncbi:ras-related protein Rab-37-like isoform X3 [Vespula pensylvanica]|uniref:ras-related protein Rab-37-like isoform X3 n=1 Tax=Vespula pensylvanica TaxID=30213 RepID=UPI001CBA57BD|nr:ras-related protein Rab-37-like isoform X3 [Vespula pensylvanica]
MTGEGSVNDNVFDMEVNGSSRLTPVAAEQRSATAPSPTGYRDYKPPAEVLSNSYSTTFHTSGGFDSARANFKRDQEKEEDFAHKTILLGDSGVGKTSLLVQFDTGNFQPGNFAATVGIGFTVMLLGDSGVGKTCLLTRFRDGRFLFGNYITTVGIDFRNKIVTVDETRVKLQIWDTAGQERFRSVTHAYYRDAHALLLLYDVTNKTSFDNIRAWLSEIREHANEDVVIMLLGNKSDCGQERVVKKEDGERLAQEYKVPFMETSAKTGLNVELAFLAVARELKARKSSDPDDTKFNVQDYVRQQSKRNSCFNSNCLTT